MGPVSQHPILIGQRESGCTNYVVCTGYVFVCQHPIPSLQGAKPGHSDIASSFLFNVRHGPIRTHNLRPVEHEKRAWVRKMGRTHVDPCFGFR